MEISPVQNGMTRAKTLRQKKQPACQGERAAPSIDASDCATTISEIREKNAGFCHSSPVVKLAAPESKRDDELADRTVGEGESPGTVVRPPQSRIMNAA
jgi:hypothetical protein